MNKDKKLSASEKMAMTAGAVSALAAGTAEAAIVYIDTDPVFASAYDGDGSTVNWDVDGDGGDDFQLWIRSSTFFSSYYGARTVRQSSNFYGIVNFASAGRFGTMLNGRGLVGMGHPGRANALFDSFTVGPTLASGYNWGSTGVKYRSAARADASFYSTRIRSLAGPYSSYYTTVSSNFGGNNASGPAIDFTNFVNGENLLGFRFETAGELFYGWAVIDIAGGNLSIDRWAYESIAGRGIHIGAIASVPEPGTLALLGLGAAGLLRLRSRRENVAANRQD